MSSTGRTRRAGLRPVMAWLGATVLWLIAGHALAQQILDAGDLQQIASAIRADGTPLVLVVWAHDCPYCRVLDEQILRPLQASGELEGRALLRKLDLDGASVSDFDGKRVGTRDFADRYRALLTPTVLFLDAGGNELAERMVGISNADFYPAYLDRAIDLARENLLEGALNRRP